MYFLHLLETRHLWIKSPLCLLPSGVIAIAEINEALNSADPQQTLAALLLPTAKLMAVNPGTAKHYHDVLQYTKRLLCQVLWLLFELNGTALKRHRRHHSFKIFSAGSSTFYRRVRNRAKRIYFPSLDEDALKQTLFKEFISEQQFYSFNLLL